MSKLRTASSAAWQVETTLYRRPHPRLARMAELLTQESVHCVLDIGCSTATLQSLLPADVNYYGCDVTDHARSLLPPGHFEQLDLNENCDLSAFETVELDAIHIGGVFEYLQDPGKLLRCARGMVPAGRPLVTSITNFAAERYQRSQDQHRWWIYKPSLDEFRTLLAETGWEVIQLEAFLDRQGPRQWLFNARRRWLEPTHPALSRTALQYLFVARAV